MSPPDPSGADPGGSATTSANAGSSRHISQPPPATSSSSTAPPSHPAPAAAPAPAPQELTEQERLQQLQYQERVKAFFNIISAPPAPATNIDGFLRLIYSNPAFPANISTALKESSRLFRGTQSQNKASTIPKNTIRFTFNQREDSNTDAVHRVLHQYFLPLGHTLFFEHNPEWIDKSPAALAFPRPTFPVSPSFYCQLPRAMPEAMIGSVSPISNINIHHPSRVDINNNRFRPQTIFFDVQFRCVEDFKRAKELPPLMSQARTIPAAWASEPIENIIECRFKSREEHRDAYWIEELTGALRKSTETFNAKFSKNVPAPTVLQIQRGTFRTRSRPAWNLLPNEIHFGDNENYFVYLQVPKALYDDRVALNQYIPNEIAECLDSRVAFNSDAHIGFCTGCRLPGHVMTQCTKTNPAGPPTNAGPSTSGLRPVPPPPSIEPALPRFVSTTTTTSGLSPAALIGPPIPQANAVESATKGGEWTHSAGKGAMKRRASGGSSSSTSSGSLEVSRNLFGVLDQNEADPNRMIEDDDVMNGEDDSMAQVADTHNGPQIDATMRDGARSLPSTPRRTTRHTPYAKPAPISTSTSTASLSNSDKN